MIYNRNDKLNFGKYKGKSLLEVLHEDARYLRWCLNNIEDFDVSDGMYFKIKEFVEEEDTWAYADWGWGDFHT